MFVTNGSTKSCDRRLATRARRATRRTTNARAHEPDQEHTGVCKDARAKCRITERRPQKPSPRPSQNASKTASHLSMPEILKNGTLPYENLIFDVSRPSKIVPKSMPKRLQNQLRFGYPLVTSKNTIFDPKTSPRWLPKISDFFKNR